MIALGLLFVRLLCDRFKPRRQLEGEILALRHQLNILRRARDRAFAVGRSIWLYRRCPSILNAITVVRPETVLALAWNGFRRLLAMEVSDAGQQLRGPSRKRNQFLYVYGYGSVSLCQYGFSCSGLFARTNIG
jgi:hypothetical protein